MEKSNYIKISSKEKRDIKKRYEAGEDLLSLAVTFHVNYGTLRNVASKEEWQKGKLNEIIYLKEVEEDLQKRNVFIKKDKAEITRLINHELERMSSELNQYDKTKQFLSLDGKEEAARNLKIKSIKDIWNIKKELYGVLDKFEEIEYQEKMAKLEIAMRRMEQDTDDVELP